MAKNGSNNNDIYDIAKLLERMEDSFYRMSNQTQLSDPYTTRMRESSVVSVKDENKLLVGEIKSLMSEFKQDIREMGLGTKEFTAATKELEKQILAKRSAGQEISTNYLERAKMAALSSWGTQSIRDIRADREPMLAFNSEKAKGNENAKQLRSMLVSPIVDKLEDVKQSILGFMGEREQREKKERGKFLENLIDGLGKSKTLGAILGDIAKLGALFGASWLRDFGPVGKALGAALVVMAPVLAKLMGDIIGKVIVNSLSGLWTGLTKVLGAMLNVGKFSRAATLAGKAGGLTTGLGRTAIASAAPAMLGYGLAATGVGAMAVDTWKSGNKAAGTALGVGAAGFGAAMLAPLIPFLAPFAPAAVAIGVIATGVGLIIKNWSKILDFCEGILEKLGIIAKVNEDSILPDRTVAPGAVERYTHWNQLAPGGGSTSELLQGKWKGGRDRHLDPTKFTAADWQRADTLEAKYGVSGEITNLGQMSQKRASEVLERDVQEKGEKSFYEKVSSDYIDWNSFKTDARSSDGKSVFLGRGVYDNFLAMKQKLDEAGYDTSQMKITSGIGTLGSKDRMSPHTYTTSLTGHFGSTAATFDTGNVINPRTGKPITREELDELGLKDVYMLSEGDHQHWSYQRLESQKARAESYDEAYSRLKDQEIEAEAQRIFVNEKKVDEEHERKAKELEAAGHPNLAKLERAHIQSDDVILGAARREAKAKFNNQYENNPTGSDQFRARVLRATQAVQINGTPEW